MKFIIKLLIKILIVFGLYDLVSDKFGDLFEDETTTVAAEEVE